MGRAGATGEAAMEATMALDTFLHWFFRFPLRGEILS